MKALSSVAVPPPVVTTTLTAPAACVGVVTSMELALPPVTVPAAPPKVTEEGEDRLVPLMTTAVPPDVGPVFGTIEVMVGGAT